MLDDLAAVHDDHLVGDLGDDAEIVGDHDDRHPELFLELVHQLEDLRLRRHVERGRRLVGDHEVRLVDQRHRDHHALAHAARELVRIVVDALLRVGMRTDFITSSAARRASLLRDVVVHEHRLLELPADLLDRVQRRHRILEDHRDPHPPQLAQLLRDRLEQVDAVEACDALRGRRSWSFSPITVRQLTLFPEPDSPTIPSVLPRSTENVTPSTACTMPSSVRNRVSQVLDLEQGHQLSLIRGSTTAYRTSTIRVKMMTMMVEKTTMPTITGRSLLS